MNKSYIPNAFTFVNLSLGICSILSAFEQDYILASILIIAAGLVDRYDGRVARYFNASSELGKELDSLADLVSFGVAPSILIFLLFNLRTFTDFDVVGLIILLTYPICGAFRLARYNTSSFDGSFRGVPITIAGCIIAGFVLITNNMNISAIVPVVIMFILSYLMVSNFKLKKL